MIQNDLKKRDWHYLAKPEEFEIASCSCGNHNTEWSEYQDYLWCSICQKDFKPIHNGIFDGPIPVKIASMAGISFTRVNLINNTIEYLNENRSYLECQTIEQIIQQGFVTITYVTNAENATTSTLNIKDFTISLPVDILSQPNTALVEFSILNGNQVLKFAFYSEKNGFNALIPDNNSCFSEFQSLILEHKFYKQTKSKIQKIKI